MISIILASESQLLRATAAITLRGFQMDPWGAISFTHLVNMDLRSTLPSLPPFLFNSPFHSSPLPSLTSSPLLTHFLVRAPSFKTIALLRFQRRRRRPPLVSEDRNKKRSRRLEGGWALSGHLKETPPSSLPLPPQPPLLHMTSLFQGNSGRNEEFRGASRLNIL